MLALIGLLTILVLLATILTKKLTPLAALIVIPIIGALAAGFGVLSTGKFIIQGVQNIAPVVAMFVFAIIFFGVLTDAGMFDPVIGGILRVVGNHPTRIVMGSALLAMIVHLDGSGAVTFLIALPPLIPLYERLKMDKRVLACVVALGAGTMNIVPWGGPTIRAATALQVSVTDLYNPVIPSQVCGLAFVMLVAYWLGRKETRRLGVKNGGGETFVYKRELTEEERQLRRPKTFWFNVILTIAVVAGLIWGKLAPAVCFMVSATLALIVNYPNVSLQRARVDAHAKAALMMASILLAAGAFIGIMKGTAMITDMAKAAVSIVPPEFGRHIPAAMSVLAMPFSLLFDPDSFYFGFLPIVAAIAKGLGVPPLQVGQAAIIGQMTTGFPISPLTPSTFLLIGLVNVELADHQKFTFLYAFLTTIVMSIVSMLIGLYPL